MRVQGWDAHERLLLSRGIVEEEDQLDHIVNRDLRKWTPSKTVLQDVFHQDFENLKVGMRI